MFAMLLLALLLFWVGAMSSRHRRKRGNHAKQTPSQNRQPQGATATAPPSPIPADLCAPSLIQSSYASFQRVGSTFGAPLLLATEPHTTPTSLAVDALVHLTEGWRFLSAALSSMLGNAPAQAVHFAYYAELRAAISLLSSHGMRISHGDNSYLERSGASKVPSWRAMRTHSVVWNLWEAWAKTPAAEALLLDQLKILPSVTIGDLKASVGRVAANPTLTRWALDLSMGKEHEARNKASYETPTARTALHPMQAADFEFVRDLWALAEPTGFGLRFEQELVRYLVHAELNDETIVADEAARTAWLQRLIGDLEKSTGTPRMTLESFFNGESSSSSIFQLAFAPDLNPSNMVARAFFLLRLATLMPNGALASYPSTPAKEWLKDWLEHVGLFDPTDGGRPEDKWMDFEHLSQLPVPPMPLPAQLTATPSRSTDTHLLARADAMLAWSTSL